jgi:signal transduction histidine kinase
LTLAERSQLPDVVALDVQQVARHLDHTAWTAIGAAEAEIVELACALLAAAETDATLEACEARVGFALRALEGTLRYGRPSFGARDTAWLLVVHGRAAPEHHGRAAGDTVDGPVDGRLAEAVYDAVLEAIQQLAPAAEEAARSAARAILDEAVMIAAHGGGPAAVPVAAPTPLPPLAFRGLADLPQVAYVVDRSLRYAYVNQAWERFAEENDGDACLAPAVVGRSWINAISGPDGEHWLGIAEQILAGALPVYREEIPCHSPMTCRFIVVTASPLRLAEDDPEVAGVVFVTHDVTDLRRAEVERLWLDREGRRVRDVFLGTVAHDLRNPLATIKGRAQLLRRRARRDETPLPASFEDSLTAIEATADQMVGQIDELLDVAQVQAGRPTRMHSRPTDLVALIRGVLKAHEHVLVGHRLRLQVPSQPLVGSWDDVRIRRVAANLLSNAVKYSPDGGEIVTAVRRELAEGRPWAVFSVQDHGIGIPAADLPSIFSSFFRGSNVNVDTGGFGLGLAGAHQIVTQHGGHIEVTSEVGVGTTFTVHLPVEETGDSIQETGANGAVRPGP